MPMTVRQQDGDTYWIEVKVCVCVCVLQRDEREYHPSFFYLPLFFALMFYYDWVMIHVIATDAIYLKAHL